MSHEPHQLAPAVPVTLTGSLSQTKPWAFTLPAGVDPRPRKRQQGNEEGPHGTCCRICRAGSNMKQWDPWLKIDQGRLREGPLLPRVLGVPTLSTRLFLFQAEM